MKLTIVLFVSLATILALAQAQDKGKGEACKEHTECGGGLKCAEQVCGCKKGEKPQFESHAQGSANSDGGVYVCKSVVGVGCDHDTDCGEHLENSKCDEAQRTCVCRQEDHCTDGAMTLTIMSLTTMMAFVVGLLKLW